MTTNLSNKKLWGFFTASTVSILLFSGVFNTATVFAATSIQIENLENVEVKSDFVVGPGKTELEIDHGGSKIVNLTVTNRMGQDKIFNLEIEDFTGSRDVGQTVMLLGTERGPYSLKDYISLPKTSFVLKHGQRAIVPVTVRIPRDAEPGGRYGSVIVSTASVKDKSGQSGSAAIVSRIGTLFFVRVPGQVKEDGLLKEFSILNNKVFFTSTPIHLQILFENNGSIYLNPYGKIQVSNLVGKEVGSIAVEPWFVMPDSLRLREVVFDRPFLLGRYTAHLYLNRGYGDVVDEGTVSFYVIPPRIVLPTSFGLLIIIFGLRWFFKKFELRAKK